MVDSENLLNPEIVKDCQASLEARAARFSTNDGKRIIIATSNILDVLKQTSTGGNNIAGVGEYDSRLAAVTLPERGTKEKVFYIDKPIPICMREHTLLMSLLMNAGYGPDQYQRMVATKEGLINLESFLARQDLYDWNFQGSGAVIRQFALELASTGEKPYLQTMAVYNELLGYPLKDWTEVTYHDAPVTGMDKATLGILFLEDPRTADAITPRITIMNQKFIDTRLSKHPEIAKAINLDGVPIFDPDSRDLELIESILRLALQTYNFSLVLKYASGHSGTGIKFLDRSRLADLAGISYATLLNGPVPERMHIYLSEQMHSLEPKSIGYFLKQGLFKGENIVMEQGMENLDHDADGQIEIAGRGFIDRQGNFTLTSIHRFFTRKQGEERGYYSGSNLVMNAEYLTTNGNGRAYAKMAAEKLANIARVLFEKTGYFGEFNMDGICSLSDNGSPLIRFTDLNNLRKGGTSASSSYIALLAEIARRHPELVPMNPALKKGHLSPEELGVIDLDLLLETPGQMKLTDLNAMVGELQEAGILPYSTSTLTGGEVLKKLKIIVPYNATAARDKWTQPLTQVMEIAYQTASEIIGKYGLTINH